MQKYANLVEPENAVKRIFSCKISFLYSRERVLQKFAKNLLIFPILLTLTPELALEVRGDAGGHRAQPRALEGPAGPRRAEGRPRRTDPSEVSIRHDHPVDGKMLLVFGCIGTDFCKKIRVLQHFSKSTRLSS